jgi:hypothetical protein
MPETRPYLLLAVLSAGLFSGCVHQQNRALDWYQEEVDLAGSRAQPETVVVEGSAGFAVLWSWDCWMDYPARAKRLRLRPGTVTVRVLCEVGGLNDWLHRATFSFNAVAGHRYRATTFMSACIHLRDLQANRVVARSKACR